MQPSFCAFTSFTPVTILLLSWSDIIEKLSFEITNPHICSFQTTMPNDSERLVKIWVGSEFSCHEHNIHQNWEDILIISQPFTISKYSKYYISPRIAAQAENGQVQHKDLTLDEHKSYAKSQVIKYEAEKCKISEKVNTHPFRDIIEGKQIQQQYSPCNWIPQLSCHFWGWEWTRDWPRAERRRWDFALSTLHSKRDHQDELQSQKLLRLPDHFYGLWCNCLQQ